MAAAGLRRLALLLLLCSGAGPALAASYTFPGSLPAGCSSGGGGSYTCGALTFGYGDTVSIGGARPATITVNGGLTTSNVQFNTAGSAGDLNLVVTGALTLQYGASIVANITAGSVNDANGGVTLGGSIATTTGTLQLGWTTSVAGSVSSTSGAITLSLNNPVAGGITSTSGNLSIGYQSVVSGAVATTGQVTLGQEARVGGAITGGSGAIAVGYGARVTGTITSSSGTISFAQNSIASACVRSTGSAAITLDYQSSVHSVCCGSGACGTACVVNNSTYSMPAACSGGSPAQTLHHVEVTAASASGLTCTPTTFTVKACADASCSTPYTLGLSGSFALSGSGLSVNYPGGASFSIASGSSSTTIAAQVSTAGSAAAGVSGLSATPSGSPSTYCGLGAAAASGNSCAYTAADAGFLFDVPNHRSETAQTVSISAVRKADNSLACTPAFASVSKNVTFTCAYQNPASGTRPVRVGAKALNSGNNTAAACDATGQAVSLAFNAAGTASLSVQYADAGQAQLSARYAGSSGGEVGLVMTGSDSFVAAPSAFAFSAVTAGPIRAGNAFAATVTAQNSAGAATPNFGRETSPASVTLSYARAQPTGSGARNGSFSGSLGSFTSGAASATNLVWSEVGRGDLAAATSNYLGSGYAVSGSTGSGGAVGRFVPHHFDVAVTPACGTFSYAGQPFTVQVSAKNASSATTENYDGSANTTPTFAQAVTLSDAGSLGVGTLAGTALAASAFAAGVATTTAPAYSYTSKLTGERTLAVRAVDADAASSAGYAEGSTLLRSGRLRLSNAYGSEQAALGLAVQAQYWRVSGGSSAWVHNAADNCTTLPAGSVALSNRLDAKGAATTAWSTSAGAVAVSGGAATLTLAAPTPSGSTGSVDVALNLGSGATDQSCLASHPSGSGAGLAWLRSQYCATTWDRDPSARASFGVYVPELRKTVHVRELY